MRDIGYSAAVGGGTRMLTYLKSRDFTNTPVEIQAVLNGTLNFILDAMRHQGKSLSQACEEAGTLGYAEPGATNALALINGELKDVCMKACTLFNTILTQQEMITPNNLNMPTYRDCDFDRLSKDGAEHRFVVSFSNQGKFKQYPYSGSKFGPIKINDWYITGSFQYITWAMQSAGWLPGKVGNAIHIIEGEPGIESVYTLSGPGAGHEPTTSAMLADFRDLCG
jgi:homoserine dehydrogenase